MRKLYVILAVILTVATQSNASHIIGAEISYQHIEQYKYKAIVTVYRDCGECKIDGGGGGSTTSNCGSFYLYLQSSARNSCTSKSLAQFSLTRESITEILPVCSSAKTLCQTDTGFSYGVEAHVFSTEIDFADYDDFEECGFELYVKLSSRSEDVDNIVQSTGGDALYNYAYLNPFISHNSVEFDQHPQIIIPVNQAVRSAFVQQTYQDSVVAKMGRPLRDPDKPIAYQTGFTIQKPLTVWCNGDPGCNSNPNANPPVGMYLGGDGVVAYTPVKTNEQAVLVFEVEQWRRGNGKSVLLGITRRDIMVEVSNLGAKNNAPILRGSSVSATNDIELCSGTNNCFRVTAVDNPFKFPDGSFQDFNTISYSWVSELPGAKINEVSISAPPYKSLEICWNPDDSLVGRKFDVWVTATDDNCPLKASYSTRYNIEVLPNVKNTVKLVPGWCDNWQLVADSTLREPIEEVFWTVDNETKQADTIGKSNTVLFKPERVSTVTRHATHKNGCNSRARIVLAPDTTTTEFIEVVGKQTYCTYDTINIRARADLPTRLTEVHWMQDSDSLSTIPTLLVSSGSTTGNQVYTIYATAERNGARCSEVKSIEVFVENGPDILVNDDFSICREDEIAYLNPLATPEGGEWRALNHNAMVNNRIDLLSIPSNTATELCQEYTIQDATSGCKSKDTVCLWMFPTPELNLGKSTVCGLTGYFNLTNLDPALLSFGEYKIDWTINGKPIPVPDINNPHLIFLPDFTYGTHTVVGTYTNIFGCSVTDTGYLVLLDELDLSYLEDVSICQGSRFDLDEIFSVSTNGGIWLSSNQPEALSENRLLENSCGQIDLVYTYDQFGCYAQQDVTLDVRCKPVLNFNNNSNICESVTELNLVKPVESGWFSGDEVANDIFSHTGLGEYEYLFTLPVGECSFEYPQVIAVHEGPQLTYTPSDFDPICEGDERRMNAVQVVNGELSMSIGETTVNLIAGEIAQPLIKPNQDDLTAGIPVIFRVSGKEFCPLQEVRYHIDVNPVPSLNLVESKLSGCSPFEFKPQVEATQHITDWSGVDVTWNISPSGTVIKGLRPNTTINTPGTYSITVQAETNKGCTYENEWSSVLTVHETPIAQFTADPKSTVTVRNAVVQFYNQTESNVLVTYHWDFGTGKSTDVSSSVSPAFDFGLDTGTYMTTLTVTADNGCKDVAYHTVRVLPDIQIFIPTAFSPNDRDNHVNNALQIRGSNVASFHVEIFNRWGQKVYISDDIDEEWDGKSSGKFCDSGIFAYYISAVSKSGAEYEFKGTIHLVR